MRDFSEFVNYFQNLAAEHVDICDFAVGNSKRILNRERSEIKYPCMWLEYPSIHPKFDEDRTDITFRSSLIVFENAQLDDWNREDYVLNKTSRIMIDLIRRINQDCEEGVFETAKITEMEPIETMSHDNDFGWRVEIVITDSIDDCCDECKFTSLCPVGAIARFNVANNNAGDFTDLVITDMSQPEGHDWEYSWEWQFDGGKRYSSSDDIPEISGSGKKLNITLTLTDDNGCKKEASVELNCNPTSCVTSVPYLYKSN